MRRLEVFFRQMTTKKCDLVLFGFSKMRWNFPAIYHSFTTDEQQILNAVLIKLAAADGVQCIFWGGSTTIAATRQPGSDVDLWVVLSSVNKAKRKLQDKLHDLNSVTYVYDGGYLPWLGHFLSIYFFPDCSFSVDIGFCDTQDLSAVNPGPNPFFVYGAPEAVEQVSTLLKHQEYEVTPETRAGRILVNMIKIRKCLRRGHIWNAQEYLKRARSELIGIMLHHREQKPIYYTRPERDAEDFLSVEERKCLSETCPKYSAKSVATCSEKLISECLRRICEMPDNRLANVLMLLSQDIAATVKE